jgi:hypothetical protein
VNFQFYYLKNAGMNRLFFLVIALLFISTAQAQSVGIGTTTPNASAQLDVSSTAKGFQ